MLRTSSGSERTHTAALKAAVQPYELSSAALVRPLVGCQWLTRGLLPGICVMIGAKPTHRALPIPAAISARLSRRQVGEPSSAHETSEAEASAAKVDAMTGSAESTLVRAKTACVLDGIIAPGGAFDRIVCTTTLVHAAAVPRPHAE